MMSARFNSGVENYLAQQYLNALSRTEKRLLAKTTEVKDALARIDESWGEFFKGFTVPEQEKFFVNNYKKGCRLDYYLEQGLVTPAYTGLFMQIQNLIEIARVQQAAITKKTSCCLSFFSCFKKRATSSPSLAADEFFVQNPLNASPGQGFKY